MNFKTYLRPFGGMTQWLYQRFTALYMMFYIVILITTIFLVKPITFDIWSSLFSLWYVKISTILFFYLMFFHAWIGVLHVTEDYIKIMWLKKIVDFLLLIIMVLQIIYLSTTLLGHSVDQNIFL